MRMQSFSMGDLFIVILLVIVAFIVVGIIYWIFTAIGLHMYAKKHNIDNTWLAWMPLAQFFYLLYIYDVKFKPQYKLTLIGGISIAATVLLSFIGFSIPFLIFVMGYAMFWLFKRHKVNLALQMVIMVITLGFSIPFQLMLLSRRPLHHQYIEVMDEDIFDEPEF